MLRRVSWGAVAALLFLVLAVVSAEVDHDVLAVVFALGSITWAVLSLKERT